MTGGQIGFYYHHHMPIPLDSHPKHLRRHLDPQGLFNATFKHEYSIIRLIHMTLILICHISGQYIQLTVYIYICIRINMYAYIYIIYIYIFMYTYKHIHIHIMFNNAWRGSAMTSRCDRWRRPRIYARTWRTRPPAATCGYLRPPASCQGGLVHGL